MLNKNLVKFKIVLYNKIQGNALVELVSGFSLTKRWVTYLSSLSITGN